MDPTLAIGCEDLIKEAVLQNTELVTAAVGRFAAMGFAAIMLIDNELFARFMPEKWMVWISSLALVVCWIGVGTITVIYIYLGLADTFTLFAFSVGLALFVGNMAAGIRSEIQKKIKK